MLEEVAAWIAKDNLESYVLNSGNLSDSLAFEGVRALIARLIELFRTESEAKGRPHALLLVTKGGTKECRPLFGAAPSRNVLVSFSVNSRAAARDHEQGAASVEDRLEAARQLKAAGWRVRIRIDPMILGYDYAWIIDQVRRLAPERVTLGTLRAEPALIRLDSEGLFAKLKRPADPKGLARYPKADRIAIYRQGVDALRAVCPVALCEETQDVWLTLGLDVDGKPCNCGA
jgi:DNA repair photolyase